MPKIFSYRKVIDKFTTHCLAEPDAAQDSADKMIELCTIDGVTYVAVPDSFKLPTQSAMISASVKAETVTDELVRKIKMESPHVLLINQRVVERIRKGYSLEDELKMLRRAVKDPDASKAYDDHVEKCVAWGKAEKAKLGL